MAEVLLLGSQRDRAVGIRSLLRQDGHRVTWTRALDRWRETEREVRPEVVVAAVASPFSILSASAPAPRGFPPPVLLVQNEDDPVRDLRVEERIVDRLRSPFMAEDLLGRVEGLVRVSRVVRRRHRRAQGKEGGSTARAASRWRRLGSRVGALMSTRVPRYAKPLGPYLEVAARVAEWGDQRDTFEPGHAERVTELSALIADALGLPDSETMPLLRAAMLHDVGKVALPAEVLRAPGPLREEQMRLLRTHPERGAAILRALDPDDRVADVILYHHEREDGSGYYRKAGDEIPRASRVLAVAEAYDAMTSSRVRPPLSPARAKETLQAERGRQFDPASVDALMDALKPASATILLSPGP